MNFQFRVARCCIHILLTALGRRRRLKVHTIFAAINMHIDGNPFMIRLNVICIEIT